MVLTSTVLVKKLMQLYFTITEGLIDQTFSALLICITLLTADYSRAAAISFAVVCRHCIQINQAVIVTRGSNLFLQSGVSCILDISTQ